MRKSIRYALGSAALAAAALAAGTLLAAESYQPVGDPIVAKECRSCHMVFPVGLLPAASWARIIDGLGNHFGETASVDAKTAEHLKAYLTSSQPSGWRRLFGAQQPTQRTADAPLRITELDWFKAEHKDEGLVTAADFQRKGAKMASDCVACHRGAEQGNFDD